MTDDDPLDLAAVAADADALERVRAGLVSGDDDALVLLRDLLLDVDVDADLPQLQPVGHGSTVLALAGEHGPERRLARGGTVVAALTAGLLSLSGVAAAAGTLAPDGSALHGFGAAVRSAAGAVVGAVTPPEPDLDRVTTTATSPSPATRPAAPVRVAPAERQPTPGPVVAAASRSKAAARQVAQLLDAAQELLADGRPQAAASRLDVAGRRLPEVLPADGAAALRGRLAALRTQVEAAAAPAPAKPKPAKPAPAQERDEPAPEAPAAREGKQRVETRTAPPKARTDAAQLSKDASAKPRA